MGFLNCGPLLAAGNRHLSFPLPPICSCLSPPVCQCLCVSGIPVTSLALPHHLLVYHLHRRSAPHIPRFLTASLSDCQLTTPGKPQTWLQVNFWLQEFIPICSAPVMSLLCCPALKLVHQLPSLVTRLPACLSAALGSKLKFHNTFRGGWTHFLSFLYLFFLIWGGKTNNCCFSMSRIW